MDKVHKESFIKCELNFFVWLVIGVIVLNLIGLAFQYVLNTALLVSIGISAIVLFIYIMYFIVTVIKVIIFKSKYECKDLKQRIASWLSSLIS